MMQYGAVLLTVVDTTPRLFVHATDELGRAQARRVGWAGLRTEARSPRSASWAIASSSKVG
jgi:hypothetical protein